MGLKSGGALSISPLWLHERFRDSPAQQLFRVVEEICCNWDVYAQKCTPFLIHLLHKSNLGLLFCFSFLMIFRKIITPTLLSKWTAFLWRWRAWVELIIGCTSINGVIIRGSKMEMTKRARPLSSQQPDLEQKHQYNQSQGPAPFISF